MSGYHNTFEIVVDAPVHTVFDYCRDPRNIYAGDPTHHVVDVTVTPDGTGTKAQVVAKTAVFNEAIALEYVELEPDRRIVFEAHPKMTVTGLGRRVIQGATHTWTWTLAPESGGTRLTLTVIEQEPPWRQRPLDALTARVFSKEIGERLARIKTGAEEQSAATA